MQSKKKVMVGMSGGVDSAVAAFLLKQRGYEVAGGTFKLWDSPDNDLKDARSVCDLLGIKHYAFDFKEIFRHEVIDDFANAYERGVTPNPCVVCNRVIKFGVFLQKARELGFDYISTGHYANIFYDEDLRRYRVRKSKHEKKDQSYVLYSLTQDQLGSAILPLADYDKPQVRKLARENGLIVAEKSESQDICFVPGGDYAAFLQNYLKSDSMPGNFVDSQGNILGRHKGVRHYTIGQRKGLGLSLEHPLFVAGIDTGKNDILLAPNDALMKSGLSANRVNWIDFDSLTRPVRLQAKIRYGSQAAPATVTPAGERAVEVLFDDPQRAITNGQSVVFYDGDYLVGGGVINASV